jgi:hypothetical protein
MAEKFPTILGQNPPKSTPEKRMRIRERRDFCPPTYLPTIFAIVGHIARADFTIEKGYSATKTWSKSGDMA